MSERNTSDFIHSNFVFPLLLLIAGAAVLWIGYTQYLQFERDLADYLMPRPENQTILLLIVGASCMIAGLLGLVRGYLYR